MHAAFSQSKLFLFERTSGPGEGIPLLYSCKDWVQKVATTSYFNYVYRGRGSKIFTGRLVGYPWRLAVGQGDLATTLGKVENGQQCQTKTFRGANPEKKNKKKTCPMVLFATRSTHR